MRAVLLDVFTDRPLTGNQLAVFVDGATVPEAMRQDLAREIRYSETVFCDPPSHPTAGDVRARIFTPALELPFAGHPVLGTAIAVGLEWGLPGGSVVTLECGVGPVPVELDDTGSGGWMRQPLPAVRPWGDVDGLLAALGVPPAVVVAPVEVYDNGPHHLVVVVDLCGQRDYADSSRGALPEASLGWASLPFASSAGRHNHRLSRKASSGSGGR